jgi:hypothetical protein
MPRPGEPEPDEESAVPDAPTAPVSQGTTGHGPIAPDEAAPVGPGTPPPGDPDVERRRLDAVRATGLVGVEAGERLDRIARQAAQAAGTPMALISLIDDDRQWNPGVHGSGAPREAPRAFSMCSKAIETPEAFVVPDASQDPEWADAPGVAGPPGVRFYAGQPIDDGEGHLIGVLCVIDTVPRVADDTLLTSLRDLAVWARQELLASSRAAGDEADAVATTDRLQELERLQSLVVSTTAHELRTPLTVLRVHAELLDSVKDSLGPDERASLEAITGAVTRLQDVSDGLVSDLRGSAGGAEEALRRWLRLEEGSSRVRPVSEPEDDHED